MRPLWARDVVSWLLGFGPAIGCVAWSESIDHGALSGDRAGVEQRHSSDVQTVRAGQVTVASRPAPRDVMTWELLAVLLLVPFVFVLVVPRLARRRRGLFAGSRSAPILTLRVERTLERRKRAALDAATGVFALTGGGRIAHPFEGGESRPGSPGSVRYR
jgi:hypothetical protein